MSKEKAKKGRKTDKEIQAIKDKEVRDMAAQLLRNRASKLQELAVRLLNEANAILSYQEETPVAIMPEKEIDYGIQEG